MSFGVRDGPSFVTLFEVRVVAVEPHGSLAYDERDWRDALVLVERGAVVLEASCGARRRFERGAVLALAGLGLVALVNPNDEPALLVSARRHSEGMRSSTP